MNVCWINEWIWLLQKPYGVCIDRINTATLNWGNRYTEWLNDRHANHTINKWLIRDLNLGFTTLSSYQHRSVYYHYHFWTFSGYLTSLPSKFSTAFCPCSMCRSNIDLAPSQRLKCSGPHSGLRWRLTTMLFKNHGRLNTRGRWLGLLVLS